MRESCDHTDHHIIIIIRIGNTASDRRRRQQEEDRPPILSRQPCRRQDQLPAHVAPSRHQTRSSPPPLNRRQHQHRRLLPLLSDYPPRLRFTCKTCLPRPTPSLLKLSKIYNRVRTRPPRPLPDRRDPPRNSGNHRLTPTLIPTQRKVLPR
jgi:hypothetical protein